MKEKLAKPKAPGAGKEPAGIIEIAAFDPRVSAGEIRAALIATDGSFINVTREFHEAGGVIRWNGDVRGLPMIDRYIARRKAIIAMCPKGYPVPDVVIVLDTASPLKIKRMHEKISDKMVAYAKENEKELDRVATEQGGLRSDGRFY